MYYVACKIVRWGSLTSVWMVSPAGLVWNRTCAVFHQVREDNGGLYAAAIAVQQSYTRTIKEKCSKTIIIKIINIRFCNIQVLYLNIEPYLYCRQDRAINCRHYKQQIELLIGLPLVTLTCFFKYTHDLQSCYDSYFIINKSTNE